MPSLTGINIIVTKLARPNAGITDELNYRERATFKFIFVNAFTKFNTHPGALFPNLVMGSKTPFGNPAIWFMRLTYVYFYVAVIS